MALFLGFSIGEHLVFSIQKSIFQLKNRQIGLKNGPKIGTFLGIFNWKWKFFSRQTPWFSIEESLKSHHFSRKNEGAA